MWLWLGDGTWTVSDCQCGSRSDSVSNTVLSEGSWVWAVSGVSSNNFDLSFSSSRVETWWWGWDGSSGAGSWRSGSRRDSGSVLRWN